MQGLSSEQSGSSDPLNGYFILFVAKCWKFWRGKTQVAIRPKAGWTSCQGRIVHCNAITTQLPEPQQMSVEYPGWAFR